MKNNLFYLILIINTLQIACSQNKEPISIRQIESNHSVVLGADLDDDRIVQVKFYLTFDITNNTEDYVSLSYPEYMYNSKFVREISRGWRGGSLIYYYSNDTLMSTTGKNKQLGQLEKIPKKYVLLVSHTPSQDSITQSMFSSYLEKMKIENKDTLHIGAISELKAKNSPIVELLEGDSILLSFGRNDIYINPILVQIK